MRQTGPVHRVLLATALIAVASACDGAATGPDITADSRALVATVWQDFDRWYAFFPMRDVDWAAIGTAYQDSARHVTSERATAELIGRMVGRLRDGHADLVTPFGAYGVTPSDYDGHFDWTVVESYLTQPARQTRSGRLQYATLPGGVAYVLLTSFSGDSWHDEIDEAFLALASAPAFILDVRPNGGGSEEFARDIAARFCDTERVYRRSRFRDGPAHSDLGAPVDFTISPSTSPRFSVPVAVITGRRNASAAEDFILMMRVLPRAVTIGDTTLGVGSYPMHRALPNGWRYRIPQSQQSTPDGFVYNWKGLAPQIAVPWDASLIAARRDPYIEAALAEVTRGLQAARTDRSP